MTIDGVDVQQAGGAVIGPRDAALRNRAEAVIPGGMYGHLNVRLSSPDYPQFMGSGQGARITDVDGREYVDLMCSWGPVIVGHRHPEVEKAALAQAALGDCLDGPSERMVELAERLVRTVAHADWAMFQKNGTDATTLCCTIARAATGRRKILVARGAYHGAAPWCTPVPAGTTPADREHVVHFDFNNLGSARAAAESVNGDLAAVLVTPYKHDAGYDQELVDPEFARGLRALCDETGAALALDDVRCGMRLHHGGSWEPIGVTPDLSAWSKSIANGYPLAAVLGTERFREAAGSVFTTGSFWFSAVPMAASLATLDVLERDDAVGHMVQVGTALRDGIAAQAESAGFEILQSGPVQMPYLSFANDPEKLVARTFCELALCRGLYVHPRHNWFISAAMTDADLSMALDATDRAFRELGDALAPLGVG